MKERNFTNKLIAEALTNMGIAISESAFKGYRQGKYNPRLEVLSAIALVLGVKEQELLC
jgi:transcriptional regulator with XRE-family HTH domain